MIGCGKASDEKFTITGTTTFAHGTCASFTVKRLTLAGASNPVSSDTVIQPGITETSVIGSTYVYSDAACTSVAKVDVIMAAGSDTATFYFKASAAGNVTISAGSLAMATADRATLDITVQ